MKQEVLQEFFLEQIRDLYDAEKQLTKALPKMAKAANSPELAECFQSHLAETENQVSRLEQVFEALDLAAKGTPCKAMKGLIEEGGEAMEEKDPTLRDLAMIGAAQRVEHYEIAAYGTAREAAKQLHNFTAMNLLTETEQEESAADSKLTEVAMSIYRNVAGEQEDATGEATEGDDSAVAAKGPSSQHHKAQTKKTRSAAR
jgi:ferritin-like metal-binding protein YciE